jgi:hypothetical protein
VKAHADKKKKPAAKEPSLRRSSAAKTAIKRRASKRAKKARRSRKKDGREEGAPARRQDLGHRAHAGQDHRQARREEDCGQARGKEGACEEGEARRKA